MWNYKFGFIHGILFLALVCLIPGCIGPVQEPQMAEHTGIVRVRVGNEGRTLMPALPSVSSYRFSFESSENPPRKPVVEESPNASLDVELTVGSWILTVAAFADTSYVINSEGKLVNK
jgi:hypothetical protein